MELFCITLNIENDERCHLQTYDPNNQLISFSHVGSKYTKILPDYTVGVHKKTFVSRSMLPCTYLA